jgi:hypothetical protein
VKPAIRIIFAPLFLRDKKVREAGGYVHGTAVGRTVTIDPRSSLLLDTLVHEMTHCNHPDWTEKMVQDYTKVRMKKMGWKEKARILKLLGNATLEGEES